MPHIFSTAGRNISGAFQQGQLNRQRLDQGAIQQQVLQGQLAEQERVRQQGIAKQQAQQGIIDLLPPLQGGAISTALGQQTGTLDAFGTLPTPQARTLDPRLERALLVGQIGKVFDAKEVESISKGAIALRKDPGAAVEAAQERARAFSAQVINLPEALQNQRLDQRIAEIRAGETGGDASGTQQLRDLPFEQRRPIFEGLIASGAGAAEVGKGAIARDLERLKQQEKKVPLVDIGGIKVGGETLTFDEQIDLIRETKRAEKLAEVRAKGIGKRESEDIANGVMAADLIPNFRRNRELLELVKTGGIDLAAVKIRKLLGVETADQAELFNSFGLTVIKQIKPAFGAQVSVKEGQWLKDVQAGFGKSTKGNIRLMERGMALAELRVKTGLRAAEAAGDFRTAEDIRRAMNFDIEKETKITAAKEAAKRTAKAGVPAGQQPAPDLSNLSDEEIDAILGL